MKSVAAFPKESAVNANPNLIDAVWNIKSCVEFGAKMEPG